MSSAPFNEETAPATVRARNSSTKGFRSTVNLLTQRLALNPAFVLRLLFSHLAQREPRGYISTIILSPSSFKAYIVNRLGRLIIFPIVATRVGKLVH